MGCVYRYDGTFAGLLTVIGSIPPERIVPAAISVGPPFQQTLFDEVTTIETDLKLVEDFSGLLAKHLTPSCCNRIRLVFLADHPEREMLICRYILLALEVGKKISVMLAHPHVAPLWKLAQQVGREAHRYQGFVRFSETAGGFYYAAISPDHRILPLIAPHFADRFRDQQWVIHDAKHGEGILHDRQRREWLLLPMNTHDEPELTPGEERFQALWQSYFTGVAIAERENLKLQQSKVPLKVRPWLAEFAQG